MIQLFINQIKQLFTHHNNKSVEQTVPNVKDNVTYNNNAYYQPIIFKQPLTDNLDSACAAITVYIREDGEFAVMSEFGRTNEEVVDISGRVLHMTNSGLLADYFLQSLQLWGNETKQNEFILKVIAQWRSLFDESELINNKLAIDPSEVFSLKDINKDR